MFLKHFKLQKAFIKMSHFVEIMTGICYNNVILMREGV